jgi:catechol 2,3-dioxygenase-like lactoylglutathione lyase family enzyme
VLPVIDHLALQVADVEAAAAFYADVFAACAVSEVMRFGSPDGFVVGLAGPDGFPRLWLGRLVEPGVRPVHLALAAPSREAVDAVHAAARAAGAEILHEPREWPEYHPGYYAVFLRDPDGNNVEAVHHG